MDERIKKIKQASWGAITGNGLLAILKIIVGLFSGSMAVIGDGIDSITDIFTSLITLITAGIISRPPDAEHPYGHQRAETIAAKVISFIIFFAGTQLFFTSIMRIINNDTARLNSIPAIAVTIISIAGKIFLALFQSCTGKKIDSPMLIANGKNMQGDIFLSGGVLIGLSLTWLFNLAILDLVVALVVSLWIMKSGLSIFMETSMELMDGIKDHSIYKDIFEIVETIPGANNPHRTRVRKLSTLYIIDMDIEVDGKLSVLEAHKICEVVETEIKKKIKNIYDIMVHVEPIGNVEKHEKFGLSNNHKS